MFPLLFLFLFSLKLLISLPTLTSFQLKTNDNMDTDTHQSLCAYDYNTGQMWMVGGSTQSTATARYVVETQTSYNYVLKATQLTPTQLSSRSQIGYYNGGKIWYVSDLTAGKWSYITLSTVLVTNTAYQLTYPLIDACVTGYQQYIVTIGGHTETGGLNTASTHFQYFDGSTWQTSDDTQVTRTRAGCTVTWDITDDMSNTPWIYFIVAGGLLNQSFNNRNIETFQFNPTQTGLYLTGPNFGWKKWDALLSWTTSLSSVRLLYADGYVYVFGYTAQVLILDYEIQEQLPNSVSLTKSREAGCFFYSQHNIYAMGGKQSTIIHSDGDISNTITSVPTNIPTKFTKTPTKSTQTPSKIPSITPTLLTKFPTKIPTKTPTKEPTKTPTKTPTKEPTKIPTKLTLNPTKSTFTPTKQPTICQTYGYYNNTKIDFGIFKKINNIGFAVNITTNNFASYIGNDIICNDNIGCLHFCSSVAACLTSNYECLSESCNIACGEIGAGTVSKFQCFNGKIFTQNYNNISKNVYVKCGNDGSCRGLEVDVYNLETFYMDCRVAESCLDAIINLNNVTYGEITCYQKNACKNLRINTNNYNGTKLVLHKYSDNVIYNNGYGFIEGVNVDCSGTNEIVRMYRNQMNGLSPKELVYQAYGQTGFPCNGLTFECGENTEIPGQQHTCSVLYIWIPNVLDVFNTYGLTDQCQQFYAIDTYSIRCDGTCATSPTQSPTSAPTYSPTYATISPTNAPTYSPTLAPTDSPTNVPTYSPTINPTYSPTLSPTNVPTNNPSNSPTLSPTNTPTYSPTNVPTFTPTNTPTNSPTLTPSNAPTYSPTLTPTNAPINSPTNSPTLDPTTNPTNSPTIDPTTAPTSSPTPSPTQSPTISNWDKVDMSLIWILANLTNETLTKIENIIINKQNGYQLIFEKKSEIEGLIEKEYFDAALKYTEFEFVINNVAKIKNNTNQYYLEFDSIINMKEEGAFSIVLYKSENDLFKQSTTLSMQQYFQDSSLVFDIPKNLNAFTLNKRIAEPFPWFIYVSGIWLGFTLFLSGLAYAQNMGIFKCCCKSYADSTGYLTIFFIGIQLWDLASDIVLGLEILAKNELAKIYFYLGIASFGTILLSYITNVIIAANIRSMVSKNLAASSWFNKNAKIFAVMVILTGGAFPVLDLCSSNIFGLEFFTTGLTKNDLNRLTKIKVFSTIVLENLPQLAIQIYYTLLQQGTNNVSNITDLDSTVLLAFCASLLSVILTIFGWWLSRDSQFDGEFVSYYLNFHQIHRQSQKNVTDLSKHATLSEENSKLMKKNRWRRYDLQDKVTKALKIPRTTLELGNVWLTDEGCIIHCIQDVLRDDIDQIKDDETDKIKAEFLVKQSYLVNRKVINKIFISHFEVTNNLFQVDMTIKYPKSMGLAKSKSKKELMLGQTIHRSLHSGTTNDIDSLDFVEMNKEFNMVTNMNEIRTSMFLVKKYWKNKFINEQKNDDGDDYQMLINKINDTQLKNTMKRVINDKEFEKIIDNNDGIANNNNDNNNNNNNSGGNNFTIDDAMDKSFGVSARPQNTNSGTTTGELGERTVEMMKLN